MRPATETVIKLFLGADRKRGGFFIVERTTCLKFTSHALERNTPFDHIDDIASRQQFFNKGIRYEAAHNAEACV